MAVAKTICEAVLEELNAYSTSATRPDRFTAARLRREIAKLEQADFMAAHLCLGILYTIERDADAALSEFEELLRYTPDDVNLHQNYAHSLAKLRMANAANVHYRIAADGAAESTEFLIDLAETSQIICRPQEFMEVLKRNKHKADEETLSKNIDVKRIIRISNLFEEAGLSDDDANSVYTAAEELFIEHNLEIESGYFRKTGMYGSSTLTFYAELSREPEFIHGLNECFCDRIVDMDASHLLKDLTYVFVAHTPITKEVMTPNCSTDLKHAYIQ
ncbi:hypothetical protein [Pseudomonas sp. TMB3-21]